MEVLALIMTELKNSVAVASSPSLAPSVKPIFVRIQYVKTTAPVM